MAKRTKERRNFLAGIITTAIEGGIGYWASARNYEWGTVEGGRHSIDYGGEHYASALVRPHSDRWEDVAEDGYPRREEALPPVRYGIAGEDAPMVKWGVLDIDAIAHGIGLLRKDDCKVAPRIRAAILGASAINECGDIDADYADVIVQSALLGEVVFG